MWIVSLVNSSSSLAAHVRTGSTGSLGVMLQQQQQQRSQQDAAQKTTKEEMKITLEGVRLAHQQPITCMQVVNDMVFTGSQDHTLKVCRHSDKENSFNTHTNCRFIALTNRMWSTRYMAIVVPLLASLLIAGSRAQVDRAHKMDCSVSGIYLRVPACIIYRLMTELSAAWPVRPAM